MKRFLITILFIIGLNSLVFAGVDFKTTIDHTYNCQFMDDPTFGKYGENVPYIIMDTTSSFKSGEIVAKPYDNNFLSFKVMVPEVKSGNNYYFSVYNKNMDPMADTEEDDGKSSYRATTYDNKGERIYFQTNFTPGEIYELNFDFDNYSKITIEFECKNKITFATEQAFAYIIDPELDNGSEYSDMGNGVDPSNSVKIANQYDNNGISPDPTSRRRPLVYEFLN